MITRSDPHRGPGAVLARGLRQAYDHVGAHTHVGRAQDERDRAHLRCVVSASAACWILALWITGKSIPVAELVWMIASFGYAGSALVFAHHVARHPQKGVHTQYACMLLDPLVLGCALWAAPEHLAWLHVLMLVIVLRVGVRYGSKAMRLQLAFIWIGGAVPLVFGDWWHVHLQMSCSLLLILLGAWWLLDPLIRAAEHTRELQHESARLELLRDALRAKAEFLSKVSHELRTPLQGIISAADLYEERHLHAPEGAELLTQMRRSAAAVATQLRDLLTLARSDAGKLEINPTRFEAGDLTIAVARCVQREAESKGLRLDVQVPDSPIFVVADPTRIEQVLSNLLTKRSATHE